MKNTTYISSLTPLRGIAALWVVVFHIDEIFGFVQLDYLLPRSATALIARGYLWVDFFFILSGFIICHVYGHRFVNGFSRRAFRGYTIARFSRLYPLHLFCLLVHIAACALLLLVEPPGVPLEALAGLFDPVAIPTHLFMAHAVGIHEGLTWNVPSWSIAAEWWTYMLAVFLFPFLNTGSRWTAWGSAVAGFVALCALAAFAGEGSLDLTYDFGFLRCLFEFTIGIALYQGYKKGWGRSLLGQDSAFAFVTLLVVAMLHVSVPDVLLVPVFSLLILGAAYNEGVARRVLNLRPLRFLGDISYSIYMMQGIWLLVLWVMLSARVPGETPALQAWMLATVGATVLSAIVTYRFVEVPGRKYVRKRLDVTPERATAMAS